MSSTLRLPYADKQSKGSSEMDTAVELLAHSNFAIDSTYSRLHVTSLLVVFRACIFDTGRVSSLLCHELEEFSRSDSQRTVLLCLGCL